MLPTKLRLCQPNLEGLCPDLWKTKLQRNGWRFPKKHCKVFDDALGNYVFDDFANEWVSQLDAISAFYQKAICFVKNLPSSGEFKVKFEW